MHIQVSGQSSDIGDSLQSAAESRHAAMAAGRLRRALLRMRRDQGLQFGSGARKRLERYERYSTRRGNLAEAAGQEIGARPTPMSRKAAHGGLYVGYRRPDGNIGWIDAGLERLARG